MTDVSQPLGAARLVTPISGLVGGNGSFKINGVDVAYKDTDSITTILNRINASGAKVTATYDTVRDRINLTAADNGAQQISLADVTGNFLAATGLAGATQTLGQNAVYSIDTINGGAPLSSSSNKVVDVIPGVTLDLKSVSAAPVKVTVGQDSASTKALVKTFVDKFNAILDTIETQTKYDAKTRQGSPLTGDSAVAGLERRLRSLVSGAALGVTGSYQNLASIGISTGKVGSGVGTANRLQLDEAKLTAALENNPQSVEALLSSFQATLGAPTTGSIAVSATGTPTKQHEDGTYQLTVLDASNKVEVRFVTTDGRTLSKTTGVLTPGADNTTLIPGVKIRAAGTLTMGATDQIAMTVTQRGIGVQIGDYLDSLLAPSGLFATREDAAKLQTKRLAEQVTRIEDRLKDKEAALQRRFTGLESAMARLQSQSGALQAQLAKLGS